MKWISSDIEMYVKAKDFVDTVAVPLIPISLKEDIVAACEMGEFISIMSTELEREYKGRLIVLPPFTYLKQEDTSALIERLNYWCSTLMSDNVKHVILITSDSDWKLNEKNVQAPLIWIPSISFAELDKKYIEQMMKSQMKPLQSTVMTLWKKED